MNTISQNSIREYLKIHQKRLRAGDNLLTFKALADLSGVHRDTAYSLLAGNRINHRSQYALSKAIQEVEAQTINQTKTKILSVNLTPSGAKLTFGMNKLNIFD